MALQEEIDVELATGNSEPRHAALQFYVKVTTTEATPFEVKAPVKINIDDKGKPELDATEEIFFNGKWHETSVAISLMGGIEEYKKVRLSLQTRRQYKVFDLKAENDKRIADGLQKLMPAKNMETLSGDYFNMIVSRPKQIDGFVRMIVCIHDVYNDDAGKQQEKKTLSVTLHDFESNEAYIVSIPINNGNIRNIISQLTNIDYSKDVRVKIVATPKKVLSEKDNSKWSYNVYVAKSNKSVNWRFVELGKGLPFCDINGETISRCYSDSDYEANPSLIQYKMDAFNDIVKHFEKNPSLKRIDAKNGGKMFVIKGLDYSVSKNPTTNKDFFEKNEDCVIFTYSDYSTYQSAALKKYQENMANKPIKNLNSNLELPPTDPNSQAEYAANADDPNGDLPF